MYTFYICAFAFLFIGIYISAVKISVNADNEFPSLTVLKV